MLPGVAENDLVRFRDPEIAALATSMAARLPELADRLAERILNTVDAYGPGAPVPPDDLRTTSRLHYARIALASSPPGGNAVTLFDDAPLSVVVASAPDTRHPHHSHHPRSAARRSARRARRAAQHPRHVVQLTGVGNRNRSEGVPTSEHRPASAPPHRGADRPVTQRPSAVAELRIALETIRWLPASDG
jgi:hypothetical protein